MAKYEMAKSMFGIVSDFDALFDLLEDEELSDEQKALAEASWFDELCRDIERKADSYAYVIAEAEARKAGLATEIARLQALKGREDKKIEKLKAAMHQAMTAIGVEKLKTPLHAFSICKNGGKQGLDVQVPVEDLSDAYLIQQVIYRLNEEAVREALAAGTEIPGVCLKERGTHLRIK